MSNFEIPKTADERRTEINKQIESYINEYKEFKEKGKKACGSRAKKALTVVKKLIIDVRRDIQDEIDTFKKEKPSIPDSAPDSVSEEKTAEPVSEEKAAE